MDKTNDKLPEEIQEQIKNNAALISGYKKDEDSTPQRSGYYFGYIAGATAWAPWKFKHDELQAQVNELDAIVNLFDKLGDCVLVRDSVETYKRKKALQQFKDGKGKEIENKEVNPLVLLHNPQK